MFRALYTAASGMLAQQLNLDTIANNLANASTVGFRETRLQFQDLVYQEMVVPGSAATQQTTVSAGLQIGLGTRAASSEVLQLQGEFDNTGNSLDLAIQGAGFFQVKQTNGEIAYTRAGSFQLDQSGNVVTANGNPLEPAIAIPHRRHRHQRGDRRNGDGNHAGANQLTAGRRHSTGHFPQSRGPVEQWQRSVYPNHRLG